MSAPLLVSGFPRPPRWVRHALEALHQAEMDGLAPATVRSLERPWDPATCPEHVRIELWPWLDKVVGWLNDSYAWQTAHAVPPCWPAHPHLVHELAVLACLRAIAADATSPDALEAWHRYALPGFCHRMGERLGAGCPPGRHADWPARSWAVEYDSEQARETRHELFAADLAAVASTRRAPGPDEPGSAS